MKAIRRFRNGAFYSVGADIFAPYLKECKCLESHDDFVLCDARMLPFKTKSFDIVWCLSTIEHLEKEEGWKLIRAMEGIARQPQAAGDIQRGLIITLALIESLVIYALLTFFLLQAHIGELVGKVGQM